MKKRKLSPKLYIKPFIGLAAFVIFLILLLAFVFKTVRTMDFFIVKETIVRESFEAKDNAASSLLNQVFDETIDISYLKGKNLFAVDLDKEENYLSVIYPGYKKVRLVRVLPNRVFADFIRRKPVAYVKLYRNFSVDDEGVLFSLTEDPAELGLPAICGLETKIFGPKSGRKYNAKDLITAVTLIKLINTNKVLKNLKIIKVDVSSPANTVLFVLPPQKTFNVGKKQAVNQVGIEIKIGQDYLVDKINILSSLFAQINSDWTRIKYVDLRFKEPVIKIETQDKNGGA